MNETKWCKIYIKGELKNYDWLLALPKFGTKNKCDNNSGCTFIDMTTTKDK
jgi:hypothetical protein